MGLPRWLSSKEPACQNSSCLAGGFFTTEPPGLEGPVFIYSVLGVLSELCIPAYPKGKFLRKIPWASKELFTPLSGVNLPMLGTEHSYGIAFNQPLVGIALVWVAH